MANAEEFSDLFVTNEDFVQGDAFKQNVVDNGGLIHLHNVPKSITELKLKGYQLLRQPCTRTETELATFTLTINDADSNGGEDFER